MSEERQTPQEYLDQERKQDGRTEYVGERAGEQITGNFLHTLLATNVAGELRHRLKGADCRVLNCDMRLSVPSTGLFAYPDVQVVSKSPEFVDAKEDTLVNPHVIVEVLSDNSAAWDQGGKFWHYRHIDSLMEYLLISHRSWLVDHYLKQTGGAWILRSIEGKEGLLQLVSAKCQLPLAEIYGNSGISPAVKPRTGN